MLIAGDRIGTGYERFPDGSPKFAARDTRYRINDKGEIEELKGFAPVYATSRSRKMERDFDEKIKDYPITTISQAINEASKVTKKSVAELEEQYKDQLSQDRNYNTLAEQIAALTGRGGTARAGGTQMVGIGGGPSDRPPPRFPMGAPSVLGIGSAEDFVSERNYGSSDLASRLNFQVSDQQIIDDFNQAKLGRLNRIVEDGNAQITGISERLNTANTLLSSLPSGDARRTSSEVYIRQLQGDLKSVQDAVANAQGQITNFKPLTPLDAEGLKEITSFREFVKLPEERASDQLRQIDPEAYQTAIGLGQRYREMATGALPDTTDPRTEELRGALEDEALNQLRLGSTLDQEVRRNVEQGVRAAQTARGNIFGVGPAVEEAMQTGLAGEQRKLARYGAAAQFLGSGLSRSDAMRDNLAFRDTLLANRLGRASDFIAAGPSIGNLSQARLGQQQNMFANYINANQANPGQFNAQASQIPFYQTANPNAGFMGAQNAADIYRSLANYQSSTYGAQVGAIANSYQSGANAFGAIAGGIGSLIPNITI